MLRNSTELKKLIDQSLTEAKAETPKIKTSRPLCTISLSPTDLSYKAKKVKNIRMIGHFASSKCQHDPFMMAATRLILKFEDGTSSVLQFINPADGAAQLQMYSLIHSCGGVPDHAFVDYGISTGYNLALMSRLPAPVPKTIELTTREKKDGYAYRVLGLDREIKKGVIPWSALPPNVPKERLKEEDIYNKDLLLAILQVTSKAGHTHSAHRPADIVWQQEALGYTPEEKKFYNKAHSKTAELLMDSINKNPAYLAQAKEHGVYIVSPGCGDGEDMKACYRRLLKAGFNKCFAMGIDSNESLIEKNKRENTSHAFFHGDIQQIGSVLARLAREEKFVPEDKLIVILISGVLTRSVSDGSYPAHRVFQELAAQSLGKIIVATGWAKSLMNDYSLTSAGWRANVLNYCFDETNPQSLHSYRTIFVCNRQTFQEEYDTAILKSRAREEDLSVLDLSLASNPLALFDKFLHEERDRYISKVTKIDLSWSHFSPETDIIMLLKLIIQFKNIEIIISGSEPWANFLIHQLQNQPMPVSITLKQRTDNTCPYELATLPINDGRLLGIYKNPYKQILEVKATPEEKCEMTSKTDTVVDVDHPLRHTASRNNLFAVKLTQMYSHPPEILHPLNLQTDMPVDTNENNLAQLRSLTLK